MPQLKQNLEANFDLDYESNQSYHFLLKFSNISLKYPDMFDRRRDNADVPERTGEVRAEIKPLLEDPAWEVFDEVRIELEALTRRAWLSRGERTVLRVNREGESQSYERRRVVGPGAAPPRRGGSGHGAKGAPCPAVDRAAAPFRTGN